MVIFFGEADDVFYSHHIPTCWYQVPPLACKRSERPPLLGRARAGRLHGCCVRAGT